MTRPLLIAPLVLLVLAAPAAADSPGPLRPAGATGRLGHERLSDVEMPPIRPPGAADDQRRRRNPRVGRGWAVLVVVCGIVAARFFIRAA